MRNVLLPRDPALIIVLYYNHLYYFLCRLIQMVGTMRKVTCGDGVIK